MLKISGQRTQAINLIRCLSASGRDKLGLKGGIPKK
jgi:hypothetical protein